jgi:hypothetical protein
MDTFVDYDFYSSAVYGGTLLDESSFDSLSVRASYMVNTHTFGKAETVIEEDTDTEKIEAVKMAVCAVAEVLKAHATGQQAQISSESVGGHSVSYAVNANKTESQKCLGAMKPYLISTGLLSRVVE